MWIFPLCVLTRTLSDFVLCAIATEGSLELDSKIVEDDEKLVEELEYFSVMLLDELDTAELDEMLVELDEPGADELDNAIFELEECMDELDFVDELDAFEELDVFDELDNVAELEKIDELEDVAELDRTEELDDIDDDDLIVISTVKVM